MTRRCGLPTPSFAAATRAEHGYVLITVLLLAALIVATTASHARHTTLDWRQSTASLWVHETRESAQSGIAFARQVLSAGQSLGTTSMTSGGKSIEVVITDAGGDKRSIHVDATSGGLGSTVEADARVYGLSGKLIPSMTAAAAAAVAADAGFIKYTGTVTVQNQVITGTLRLGRSCHLTLRDVVLHGSIVSEAALGGPPYFMPNATTLTLQEGVRIEPTTILPGCAILIPDGSLIADASSHVEIHGIVVADSISMSGSGAMDAQVVAAQTFVLPASIDRPGLGRAPLDWPASVQLVALGLKSLAFRSVTPAGGELLAIKGFTFPAR